MCDGVKNTPQEGNEMDFVTVVSVGAQQALQNQQNAQESQQSDYVTVLTIGDTLQIGHKKENEIIEEVLVYRLPGERLGFGLKFEGGTKSEEFVKRLFIQSCAPDSPASMAKCSWGQLVEGDEILNIDSLPVSTMTRIDCVRCLKDSNVVIKMMVKHVVDSAEHSDCSAKTKENTPLVISAEKKRSPPPPPPPVPPRRIPRKLAIRSNSLNDLPPPSETRNIQTGSKFSKPLETPHYGNMRFSDESAVPPDASIYLDLLSQESGCYLSESDDTESSISTVIDRLNSFPNTTTSSFAGSLPSTPTAVQKHLNLTSVLNSSEDFEIFSGENDFFAEFITNNKSFIKENDINVTDSENLLDIYSKGAPLEPNINFYDAQLSYGNEKVECVEVVNEDDTQHSKDENANCIGINKIPEHTEKLWGNQAPLIGASKLPIPAERFKTHLLIPTESASKKGLGDDVGDSNLPRLVSAVPKVNTTVDDTSLDREMYTETVKEVEKFLENEVTFSAVDFTESEKILSGLLNHISNPMDDMYDSDLYNFNWRRSPQLPTIGEDDEEACTDSIPPTLITERFSPIVLLNDSEKGTSASDVSSKGSTESTTETKDSSQVEEEASPNAGRPPLLKHRVPELRIFSIEEPTSETPEYLSTNSLPSLWKAKNRPSLFRDEQSSCSVREKIAIFSNTLSPNDLGTSTNNLKKYSKSSDDIFSAGENDQVVVPAVETRSASNKHNADIIRPHDPIDHCTYRKIRARSSLDLSLTEPPKEQNNSASNLHKRHSFSHSLLDVHNSDGSTKYDRWSLLAEQRHKSLSKLKGLIIPEQVTEADDSVYVDLPEIKSKDPPLVLRDIITTPTQPTTTTVQLNSCQFTPCINTISWDCSLSTIPKYSPAFKRRDLQLDNNGLGTANNNRVECDLASVVYIVEPNYSVLSDDSETSRELKRSESLTEAPRSLESITSPTQSDCSFEYNSSSSETKQELSDKIRRRINSHLLPKGKEDALKSEDESDNDSAVSSSQSSYISKVSPPISPSGFQSNFITQTSNIKLRSRSESGLYQRLLKPHSVEAINRKNILASAKCRSGQDLKRGSPLVQRRCEGKSNQCKTPPSPKLTTPELAANKTLELSAIEKNIKTATIEQLPEEIIECTINRSTQEVKPNKSLMTKETGPRNSTDSSKFKYARSKTCENVLADVTPTTSEKAMEKRSFSLQRFTSVVDLRRSFEQLVPAQLETKKMNKKSSDSPTSKKVRAKESAAVSSETPDSEVTKLTKSTGLSNTREDRSDTEVITLKPEIPGGSVGITLAGGADYENKTVTIYKIRCGSSADRDGRLQKGDTIISINGKSVSGLMHAELVAALKEPLPEVTLTVAQQKTSSAPTNSPVLPSVGKDSSASATEKVADNGSIYVVPILKDVSGLGFSLDGGQDSLTGNVPLTIKKVFKGGAAEKCGNLFVGDQLLKINDTYVSGKTRFETCSVLRKLPESDVILLTIKRTCHKRKVSILTT